MACLSKRWQWVWEAVVSGEVTLSMAMDMEWPWIYDAGARGTSLFRWHYDPAVRSNEIRLTYIQTAHGL